MKHRSIGERLNRAGTQELRIQIAKDWANNWQQDQEAVIAQLEQAIQNNDHDALCQATGQLKALTQKRFTAIENVIDKAAKSDLDHSTDLLSAIPKPN